MEEGETYSQAKFCALLGLELVSYNNFLEMCKVNTNGGTIFEAMQCSEIIVNPTSNLPSTKLCLSS